MDGPENVELIFLLAIPPAEAGSTHIQVLTELTSRLADETLRARVMAATTAAALLAALDDVPQEDDVVAFVDAPTIVCVTACPAGIAHTYMAAEYLEKAGRKLGVNVVVEKQGANGIEGRLTAQQLRTAQACIIAAEVALKESERFHGIPTLSVPVAEPLRHAEALIKRALALPPAGTDRHVHTGNDVSKSLKTELKQALLSGISFAVPLIVAGARCWPSRYCWHRCWDYSICLSRRTHGCGCIANSAGDVRHINGAGTGRVYRLLAGR